MSMEVSKTVATEVFQHNSGDG